MKCSINHPPSKTGNRVCGGVYFHLVLFRVIEIDLDQPLKLMIICYLHVFPKIFIDIIYHVWIFLTLIYARLGIYIERSVLAPDPKHTEDYFHWCSCTSSTALLTLCIYYIYICVCVCVVPYSLDSCELSREHTTAFGGAKRLRQPSLSDRWEPHLTGINFIFCSDFQC